MAGLARKLALDTYGRELEHYGGDAGMTLAEALFHADSEAVLNILENYSGESAADARWRLCLRGMGLLLEDLGLCLESKADLTAELRQGFLREFRAEGPLEHQLGNRFRRDRKPLEAMLDAHEGQGGLTQGLAILQERSRKLRPVTESLRDLAAEDLVDLRDLATSFLHMHVNRHLRSAHHAQELVIYDFLWRLYASKLARGRRGAALPT